MRKCWRRAETRLQSQLRLWYACLPRSTMPDLVRISTFNSKIYQIVAFFLIDIIFASPIHCVRKGEFCKTRASGNTRQQIWLLQLANRPSFLTYSPKFLEGNRRLKKQILQGTPVNCDLLTVNHNLNQQIFRNWVIPTKKSFQGTQVN